MSKRKGLFGSFPSYDTPLPPEQERRFNLWAGPRVADTQDYDLRGAWLGNAQQAPNGHLPDTYKKPNHPTFSDESQYSTPENKGGSWVPDGKGGWAFWAGPANTRTQSISDLGSYFRKAEPDSAMIWPLNWNLP